MVKRRRNKKRNNLEDDESLFHETPYVLIKSLKKAINKAMDSSQLQVEATKYLIFWIIFVVWVLLGTDIIMQRRMADTMKRKFVDQSFEFGDEGYLKFDDVSSINEIINFFHY